MKERPADTILKAMYRLAIATEKDETNVTRALQSLQAYQKVLDGAFLIARNDRANKLKINNVILDNQGN